MNNFKKITSMVLALLMTAPLALFAACGGDDNKDDSGNGKPVCTKTHDYGNSGICVNCDTEVKLPATDSAAEYINPRFPSSGVSGAGTEYNRYECVEDYYEFEIGSEGTTWLSFAVKEAGQYALYSTENAAGVKVTRYDASAHYVTYPGFDGRELNNKNFISTVNCAEMFFSVEWRATFCLKGNSGDKVKVRFVKIDAPAWVPGYTHVDMIPQEINGKVADDCNDGEIPVDVPYSSDYFYDETCGYYRLGTKDNPGKIIHVAITACAERLMGEMSFAYVDGAGNNLAIGDGKDAEGNFIVKEYAYFIAQKEDGSNSDNCYVNFVNSDGMYPVNQELYDFLNLYVKKNPPLDVENIAAEDVWLAACYTFEAIEEGEELNPIIISDGMADVTTFEYDWIYYVVKCGDYNEAGLPTTHSCLVSWNSDNVKVIYNDQEYTSSFEILTDIKVGTTLKIASKDGSAINFILTITEKGIADAQ